MLNRLAPFQYVQFAMFFKRSLNLRFFIYLVEIRPVRPLASIIYSNLMVPVLPSLQDQFAETGWPGLARRAWSVKPSCRYGSKMSESTLVPSNVLAPLLAAWRNISSSDSERTTFHEKPPGPSVALKSVSEEALSIILSPNCPWIGDSLHAALLPVILNVAPNWNPVELALWIFWSTIKNATYLFLETIAIKGLLEVNESQEEANRCQHALSNVVPFHTYCIRYISFELGKQIYFWVTYLGNFSASRTTTSTPSRANTDAA